MDTEDRGKVTLYNPEETARLLGVNVQTVYRWRRLKLMRTVETPADFHVTNSEVNRIKGSMTPGKYSYKFKTEKNN